MSQIIRTAIRATLKAMKAEQASGKGTPEIRRLGQLAIEAAERVVSSGASGTEARQD